MVAFAATNKNTDTTKQTRHDFVYASDVTLNSPQDILRTVFDFCVEENETRQRTPKNNKNTGLLKCSAKFFKWKEEFLMHTLITCYFFFAGLESRVFQDNL